MNPLDFEKLINKLCSLPSDSRKLGALSAVFWMNDEKGITFTGEQCSRIDSALMTKGGAE